MFVDLVDFIYRQPCCRDWQWKRISTQKLWWWPRNKASFKQS